MPDLPWYRPNRQFIDPAPTCLGQVHRQLRDTAYRHVADLCAASHEAHTAPVGAPSYPGLNVTPLPVQCPISHTKGPTRRYAENPSAKALGNPQKTVISTMP